MTWKTIVIGLAAAIGGAGCATAPLPTERLQASSAAIRAAEEVGAARDPQAAYHLQLAREQYEHARRLIADGENARAATLLQRSEADAELALALARGGVLRAEAQQAVDQARALKARQ